MSSRVHFVNRYFHPDFSATSQVLSGIAFALADAGHDVHVVAGRQLYEDSAADLPAHESVNGVHVDRVRTTRFGRQSLPGRLIDYVSFYVAAAFHLAFQLRKGDIVVVKTDPPLMSLIVAPIAKLRGAKSVNWLQDIFPEVATAVNLGGRSGQIGCALLQKLRNLSLLASDRTVVIGERMREHLIGQGVTTSHITVIPNWSDPAVVYPVPHWQNTLRQQWGLTDKFVVGYAGNLGRVHEFSTVVDAIEILHKEQRGHPAPQEMVFLFSGNGAQRQALEDEIARRGISGMVDLRPYQPIDRLAESLACADVHLVTLRAELEGFVVPSKIYGVMAAARPAIFVGDGDGEIARLLLRERCGMTVNIGDGPGLARAILKLANDPATRETMGARGRAAYEAAYTRRISTRRWLDVLEPLGLSGPTDAILHPAAIMTPADDLPSLAQVASSSTR